LGNSSGTTVPTVTATMRSRIPSTFQVTSFRLAANALERVVVRLARLLDEALQAHVATDLIVEVVQKQQ
jgi:hypothetical protein